MALIINLKYVENLRGKTDRLARLTFRGHSHNSKVIQSAKKLAYFGQSFEWTIARSIESHEFVTIEIFNFNKFLNNRLLGSFSLSMQQLIHDGKLDISDNLIDSNNRVSESTITFEIQYHSPDASTTVWQTEDFQYPLVQETTFGAWDIGTRIDEPKAEWHENSSIGEYNEIIPDMPVEEVVSQTMIMQQMSDITSKYTPEQELYKPRHFQVCVTIIEGMQFAGLDIDPVIRMEVGDEKRYTTIKRSTDCPFYNEYFVFDFFETPSALLDKMITITALHSIMIPGRQIFRAGNLLAGRLIGQFKCDVGTVYSATDHNFYNKWAVLLNPKDTSEGVKGYVKCNISVLGKGDVLKVPKLSSSDVRNNTLEGNLLLPRGVPIDRQRVEYKLVIFRAEDLPRTDFGIVAAVRNVLGGSAVALIDAFVKVSFAGNVGKTSMKKHYHPEWSEVLTFSDYFPPLCNRIKVQLCDNDITSEDAVGTHFIELAQIMDPGGEAEGILPTFGPNWIYFYGAPRDFKMSSAHEDLNDGQGEGSAYRGRLLMSLKTNILDDSSSSSAVKKEKLPGDISPEVSVRKEYLLFATFLEASMIDKKLKDKPVSFEISLGPYGNSIDDKSLTSKNDDDSDNEEEETELLKKTAQEEKDLPCESTTPPMIPLSTDNTYYYLPFNENKPCTYLVGIFEDLHKRLFHVNYLENMMDILNIGLEDVRQMMKDEDSNAHRRLRGVLEEFIQKASRYREKANIIGMGVGAGKTKLDKYRMKMCKKVMQKLHDKADNLKKTTSRENVLKKYKEVKELKYKLKFLAKEPQHSLPDVFIWMIHNKKRIAYFRFPAKDLLFAKDPDFKGKHCGKVQTIFLKKPGKKNQGTSGWVIQSKLEVCLWLGLNQNGNHENEYLKGVPPGYEFTEDMAINPLPPSRLVYQESHAFQLRAYLSQARKLIGSDDTGLSDPFARVIIANQCQATFIVDKTLSPIWNETLIYENIVLFGSVEQIVANPPTVIIEFFDKDIIGEDYLGRCMVQPKVKPKDVDYDLPQFPPQLQWWGIYRGPMKAGELLASFELLLGSGDDLPAVPAEMPLKNKNKALITPIPAIIKPSVCKYRIEVNFWGVRDLHKVQFTSVDHPKAILECAGNTVSSKAIENIDVNSNFTEPVAFMDLELPENKHFWPPITISVYDCRNFNRNVHVGVHTIGQILKYLWEPQRTIVAEEELAPKQTDDHVTLFNGQWQGQQQHLATGDVVIEIDGQKSSENIAENGYQPNREVLAFKQSNQAVIPPESSRPVKVKIKPVRKKEIIADLDWWSKYYLSKERHNYKNGDGEDSSEDESETDDDLISAYGDIREQLPDFVDYSCLDANKLKEMQEQAIKLREEREERMNPKKKKKKMRKAKKRLKKLQGIVNDAFQNEVCTEELIDDETHCGYSDLQKHVTRLQIYDCELEKVKKFGGFLDNFETFDLFTGKKEGDEDEEDMKRICGKFKGNICIYKLKNDDNSSELDQGILSDKQMQHFDIPKLKLSETLPSYKPQELDVFVYIVNARDLHPADSNGKADPYILLKYGQKEITDRENRMSNQLNPVFGRLFKFEATFPMDSLLRIQVMDSDFLSSDDLIGETTIDLENRFFSKHRGTCGISSSYDVYGYNTWRDTTRPSQILEKLCKTNGIELPKYDKDSVTVCDKIFYGEDSIEIETGDRIDSIESIALEALKHWEDVQGGCYLVPEHVETRTLYNPEKPGVEQGKLEMWIDMFPKNLPNPQIAMDITPRMPVEYELRVIIYDTEDVILDDENIAGEKSSDIFVRGYLKGKGDDDQQTDVHYRSLTGEGNFNWRFVTRFDYLKAEEKAVFRKKMGPFDLHHTEVKIPPKLTLQVWDADIVSADDFLGSITLDLNNIPRPSKSSKHCKLGILKKQENVKPINLFKNKTCNGWWPFWAKEKEGAILAGKVHAEIQLFIAEDADKAPVGRGREPPMPLPEPNRPDTSFLWFMNPWKSLRYIIWKNYKWLIIKLIVLVLFLVFMALLLYNIPGASVDKMFGSQSG